MANSGRPSTRPMELESSMPSSGLRPGGLPQGAARKNIQPRVCMARSAKSSQPMLVGISVVQPMRTRKPARPSNRAARAPRPSSNFADKAAPAGAMDNHKALFQSERSAVAVVARQDQPVAPQERGE